MTNSKKSLEEEVLLNKLKEILLKEDREELARLKATLDDPALLSQKISPVIESHIDFLKKNFPKEFKHLINDTVEQKIRESQTDLLNVIYPVMGKMIRKYITHQFQLLKDSIDEQVRNTFSVKGYFQQIRSTLFGVKGSDMILRNVDVPIIEEAYVIQRNSGLLLASASVKLTIDQDVIAGMLTAIKGFVEDAFKRESEELEMIEYGSYKIFIQNFHSYYIALAMSGSLSTKERERLSTELFDFAEKELSSGALIADQKQVEHLSEKLKHYFFNTPRLEINKT